MLYPNNKIIGTSGESNDFLHLAVQSIHPSLNLEFSLMTYCKNAVLSNAFRYTSEGIQMQGRKT